MLYPQIVFGARFFTGVPLCWDSIVPRSHQGWLSEGRSGGVEAAHPPQPYFVTTFIYTHRHSTQLSGHNGFIASNLHAVHPSNV